MDTRDDQAARLLQRSFLHNRFGYTLNSFDMDLRKIAKWRLTSKWR